MRIDLPLESSSSRIKARPRPSGHNFVLTHGCEEANDALIALTAGIDPDAVARSGDILVGLDVELQSALPRCPTPELSSLWSTQLLDDAVMAPLEEVARDVLKARRSKTNSLLTLDPRCSDHPEALDFSEVLALETNFFYMKDRLHRRRIRMLAGVVAAEVERLVQVTGSATVLDVGPGVSSLFRCLAELLAPTVRSRCTLRAVDVSEDLLRYGMHCGWIDEGFVADLGSLDSQQLELVVGGANVVVLSEVLEHLHGSVALFGRTLLPLLKDSRAYFVGSVPNSVQGVELVPLMQGTSSPHQLSRHLVDETTGHVSFYTYATLRSALSRSWKVRDAHIWSNGLRIDRGGASLCYDAALRFPHRGDRLCFAARC